MKQGTPSPICDIGINIYIYIRVYNGVLNKGSLRQRRYLENHNGLGLGCLQARIIPM
jgi:hypothetical protein